MSVSQRIQELVDVVVPTEPYVKNSTGSPVPLILVNKNHQVPLETVTKWVTDNQAELERLLAHHGGILFRGFPLLDPLAFSAFVNAFQGWKDLPYEDSLSYAVRIAVCDRVCTTNEGKTGGMVFHHEQAQSPKFPSKVFFWCQQPAAEGGATGISPSDVLLDKLREKFPDFVKDCETKGVQYTARLPEVADTSKGVGRSWKSFFGKETKESVEQRMSELGYTWEWQEGGVLKTVTPVLPAVVTAPGTEPPRQTFFNQMIAQYLGNAKEFSASFGEGSATGYTLDQFLRFGDGSSVPIEPLEYGNKVSEDVAVEIQWQAGDVALLDNYLVMHARRPFEGTRKLMASLVV